MHPSDLTVGQLSDDFDFIKLVRRGQKCRHFLQLGPHCAFATLHRRSHEKLNGNETQSYPATLASTTLKADQHTPT
jgi:hypothetical protein